MKPEKALQGQININRTSGREDGQVIKIELIDQLSRSHCVEIRMTLEQFAAALTGLSAQACTFQFRPDVVGKTREFKDELVFIPDGLFEKRGERAAKAVKEFEKDGWIGCRDDASNNHRVSNVQKCGGGTYYRVGFHRYVDTPE